MSRFPNLFLIGAPKAGTTFLHAQFSKSSDIFCALNKEPFYFIRQSIEYLLHGPDRKKYPLLPEARDKNSYLALYKNWANETYAIDASTFYLSAPGSAQSISETCPDARIIAILREPVSRAYSHYLMGLRDGWFKEDLEFVIEHELEEIKTPEEPWGGHYRQIRNSLYLNGLKDYYERFGADKMRVYLFEDIVKKPEEVLADVSKFLNIEPLTLIKADEDRNSYAVDRLPIITRMINKYRASPVRSLVNALTPRKARDLVRKRYDKTRLKSQGKPTLTAKERQLLEDHLGNDYTESIAFARENGLLFEKQD